MRQHNNGQIFYSPSDLVNFLGCHHASFLDVQALRDDLKVAESGAIERLLQEKGMRHEAAYLEHLKGDGKSVAEIPKSGSLQKRAALTLAAMKSGVDVVYQAVLLAAPWHGYADFLIKCDAAPESGAPLTDAGVRQAHPPHFSTTAPHATTAEPRDAATSPHAVAPESDTPSTSPSPATYEVLDTKLSRTASPKHLVQLCIYSDLLTRLQGARPANMHLLLGDNEKHTFRVTDYAYYAAHAQARLEDYVQNLPAASSPEPCSHCSLCRWRDACAEQWKADDHLSLVANIMRSQRDKLRAAGIHTVAALAATKPDAKIPKLNHDTFQRLRSQAALQQHKADTGEDKCETIPHPPNKGFARLPEPAAGDLFFDMEGDPLYPDGLEYLFGVHYLDDGEPCFKPFWGHDHDEEKQALDQFMGFLADHLATHPRAYIYHYNHYETTALKRLTCRYAVREEQLDSLLRGQKFVDLYKVVRESIRTSEPSYSLKNLETFYMEKRTDGVATADESIIVYNQWRESGDADLLQSIADYNETDCVSTRLLRDWLLTLRPADTPWFGERKSGGDDDLTGQQIKDWEIEYQRYQKCLAPTDSNPPSSDASPPQASGDQSPVVRERLSHLLEFHHREAKPQWWATFECQDKFEDELIDDTDCLAGLRQVGSAKPDEQSSIYTYRFPPQDYKVKVGDRPILITKSANEIETAGTIVKLDDATCLVEIRRGNKQGSLPKKLSLGTPAPIDSKVIRSAIYRYADYVLQRVKNASNANATSEEDAARSSQASGVAHPATELLARNIPRIRGKRPGEPIITSNNLQAGALEAIAGLDNSYLFMQGPPGAGKTYTCSHIIVELLKRGKRIGVTSNSHKAIHNLLKKVESVAAEQDAQFRGFKKHTAGNEGTMFEGRFINSVARVSEMDIRADLFAGTVWTFANEHFNCPLSEQLDYLFIDEAGQVATANIVAMAAATKNIILVGDQMQLGQPIQGTHPGEAGLSILEFLLGERSTIPAERGIFLGQTWRMRPSICRFISDAFYDGRLTAHESTSERRLNLRGDGLPDEGIAFIAVEHEGRSQKSEEEGEMIKAKYEELLGREFIGREGTRAITEDDILVVSPYNLQVNHLRSLLPQRARVGTVDIFQGQEAPIVLVSMATSSAEYLPRDVGFLYSRNRLNVALSRAQCLAVMVASPRLLETPCKKIEQMRLVNTFCRLKEYASECGA